MSTSLRKGQLAFFKYLWVPTNEYLPMSTYLWVPTYEHLPMSTYLWVPTYEYLPMSTYQWVPTWLRKGQLAFFKYLPNIWFAKVKFSLKWTNRMNASFKIGNRNRSILVVEGFRITTVVKSKIDSRGRRPFWRVRCTLTNWFFKTDHYRPLFSLFLSFQFSWQ